MVRDDIPTQEVHSNVGNDIFINFRLFNICVNIFIIFCHEREMCYDELCETKCQSRHDMKLFSRRPSNSHRNLYLISKLLYIIALQISTYHIYRESSVGSVIQATGTLEF